MKEDYKDFIEKLESQHTWPSVYMFKFIVQKDKQEELERIFESDDVESRESSAGKYISIPVKKVIRNSQEVIDIYEEVNKIEGVIAL